MGQQLTDKQLSSLLKKGNQREVHEGRGVDKKVCQHRTQSNQLPPDVVIV